MSHTEQSNTWRGDFGRQYTDRNPQNPDEMEALYRRHFGVSRSHLNEEFLGNLDHASRILEVGANMGLQLLLLQEMGFQNLYGIELQTHAIRKARQLTKDINLIQGNALDIPFKDDFFDLVYTSGVLIHISPENIPQALKEIYRCSKRYIWGFEYFAESHQAIPYRGKRDLLWKANFARLYLDSFPDLRLVAEKKVPYLDGGNIDAMFLLEKTG